MSCKFCLIESLKAKKGVKGPLNELFQYSNQVMQALLCLLKGQVSSKLSCVRTAQKAGQFLYSAAVLGPDLSPRIARFKVAMWILIRYPNIDINSCIVNRTTLHRNRAKCSKVFSLSGYPGMFFFKKSTHAERLGNAKAAWILIMLDMQQGATL